MITRCLIAAAALLSATQTHAEHLYPRDECSGLDGADQFRMALVTAVANRNADLLRPLVDPQVNLDFGGGSGWDLLNQRLEERDLWVKLDDVLSLGCAPSEGPSMVMPWVWEQDFGIEDPFSAMLTRGDAVPLRSAPGAEARLIRNMRWEAVQLVQEWQGDEDYLRVRTKKGEVGYAPANLLRHQLEYRLIASRADGRWEVTTFIAGD